jgi:Asp-tRNA(Asn)/Glu-tRNA(Gln) amidotransferase A subunit family amidase
MNGVVPLAQSLDLLGIMARAVDCVRRVYRAIGSRTLICI